jgi:cytochrome c oxidase subunit I+III
MNRRPIIDLSHLPENSPDSADPLWLGNLLMICIEGTMFMMLTASYFYIRQNFHDWPPTRVQQPLLWLGSANALLLAASCIPMYMVDRLARHEENKWKVVTLLAITVVMGLGSIVLRALEFQASDTRWDQHAYGSVLWTMLGFHLFHLLGATGEATLMAIDVARHELDPKHQLDVRVTAVYWYFICVVWAVLYGVIYLVPRLAW